MRIAQSATTALLFGMLAQPAYAELWHPLDTVPKPNVVVAVDHSVTMAITPNCNSCHRDGLSGPSRLMEVKSELSIVMPMFQDYFQYSAFTYSACGQAQITGRSPIPVSNNTIAAYNSAIAVINGAWHCNQSESNWPSGAAGLATSCLTPTPGCIGDGAAAQDLITGGVPGLAITLPVVTTATTCDLTGGSYDLGVSLMLKLAGGGFTWPRWSGANTQPTADQVRDEFCTPLDTVLQTISTELNTCTATPSAIWDMSFLGGGVGTWCQHGIIHQDICDNMPSGVPAGLRDTCTCDMTQVGCDGGGIGLNSACGHPLSWKARQQVAVCEAYDTNINRFGRMFINQPDNKVNVGGCRENVALFMTDGYMGYTAGTAIESNFARPAYGSTSVVGLSNMFVFRISNVFGGHANAMQAYVSNDPFATAYDATNLNEMSAAFARVLSRIFKGVYVGAKFGMDDIQSLAFLHAVTVPGANGAVGVDDNYLGFPTRVSAYNVNANTGALTGPIWETDWTSKAVTAPGCYNNLGGTDVPILGPDGNFGNGTSRVATINSGNIDRDGNSTLDATAGGNQIRFGRMQGFASSKPIVVGWPSETAPNGNDASWATYRNAAAFRTRRQMVYFSDGGYVYGVHGGNFTAGLSVYGFTSRSYRYTQVADSGKEVLRYRPNWLNDAEANYRYTLNDMVPQPMITGELLAQEVYLNGGVPQWATILVGNQGKSGRGYFVLNVTNPCAPTILRQWVLPSTAKASAAPTVHYIKKPVGGFSPAVFTVGGADAPTTAGGPIVAAPDALYVYNLDTGVAGGAPTLVSTIALPASGTASYTAAPICLSSKGGQAVDVCYALREDGLLAKANIGINGALVGAVVDATPTDAFGVKLSMTSGEVFTAAPVAYFDSKGRVNVVFGGGDFRNLTSTGGQNYLYRAVDNSNREAAPSNPTLAAVCIPDGGGSTAGRIAFGAGERLISSPIIANGIVAAATYSTQASGCVAGAGRLYAMNSETCVDASNPATLRPAPVNLGSGIPTSPSYHRNSGMLVVGSSAKPLGTMAVAQGTVSPKGRRPVTKRLYFRLNQNLR